MKNTTIAMFFRLREYSNPITFKKINFLFSTFRTW